MAEHLDDHLWLDSGGQEHRGSAVAKVVEPDRRQASSGGEGAEPHADPSRPQRRAILPRKGFTETDYARLLDAAHQQLGGPMVVVWDNLNTHVSAAMTGLIAARNWLTVYQLPPYAHELNPVEPVWSQLKRSLANLTKHNLSQLTALVKTRLKRMQHRPGLLDGFLASTGLDLAPSVTPTIKDL